MCTMASIIELVASIMVFPYICSILARNLITFEQQKRPSNKRQPIYKGPT